MISLWLETPPPGKSREVAWRLCRDALAKLLPRANPKIRRTSNGKPYVVGKPLHFSLSHAPALVAFCVCSDREVGVDVESLASGARVLRMADDVLSAAERAELAEAASSPAQSRRATELWALKEAYVKAYGTTIGDVDPALLGFSLRGRRPRLVSGGVGPAAARVFSHAGHAVAVVAVGRAPLELRTIRTPRA